MKSTSIENKLFPLSSLVFGTIDNDDGEKEQRQAHASPQQRLQRKK